MSLLHHSLQNAWIIRGTLELMSPLHIGVSERGAMGMDAKVVRWPDGRPVIPGSSLKGVLRSFLETVGQNESLRNLLSPEGPPVCIITENPCGREFRKKEDRDKWRRRQMAIPTNGDPDPDDGSRGSWDNLSEEEKAEIDRELAEAIYRSLCPICRLFGNQLFAGKISIPDLVPEQGHPTEWFDVRDGVGIDRDTRTARNGVKYDFELVNPGVVFPLTVRAMNLEDDEQAWLLLGLEALRNGELFLGGKTSRGLGSVRGIGSWRISRMESRGPEDIVLHYLGRDEEEDYEPWVNQVMGRYMSAGR
ncbi:RAMP superfamily CRISPR-associated protein [Kyrpidia spormannii]|nr:RAMP superfamily CRISPR-associated protein [Kyrpidia spormannii]